MNAEQFLDDMDTSTLDQLRRVRARVNDLTSLIEGRQRPDDRTVEVQAIPGGCLRLEW